jgi:CheY-like chemotaxis protein
MSTAVVCDDDPTLRAAISKLCDEVGLEVVAETDVAGDAAMLVRRFDVSVLVIDTSLSAGSGESALEMIRNEDRHPQIIVFSMYADDVPRLRALGAREVVKKPDLVGLREALARVSAAIVPVPPGDDRRLTTRLTEDAPPIWTSPSGLSPAQDLTHSILTLEPGDSVLAMRVLGLEALESDVGALLADDCRLATARLLRSKLRVQDLLHMSSDDEAFVALLRGGDARSADAVWSRVVTAIRHEGLPGEPHGAGARVDPQGGGDAVNRAVGAVLSVGVGGSAFLSV